jgi:hypothetical protein
LEFHWCISVEKLCSDRLDAFLFLQSNHNLRKGDLYNIGLKRCPFNTILKLIFYGFEASNVHCSLKAIKAH